MNRGIKFKNKSEIIHIDDNKSKSIRGKRAELRTIIDDWNRINPELELCDLIDILCKKRRREVDNDNEEH